MHKNCFNNKKGNNINHEWDVFAIDIVILHIAYKIVFFSTLLNIWIWRTWYSLLTLFCCFVLFWPVWIFSKSQWLCNFCSNFLKSTLVLSEILLTRRAPKHSHFNTNEIYWIMQQQKKMSKLIISIPQQNIFIMITKNCVFVALANKFLFDRQKKIKTIQKKRKDFREDKRHFCSKKDSQMRHLIKYIAVVRFEVSSFLFGN